MKNDIEVLPLEHSQLGMFKRLAQEAFQQSAVDHFGEIDCVVLPDRDIDSSLNAKGSASYVAVCDGEILGGVIVVIGPNGHGSLDILFVT